MALPARCISRGPIAGPNRTSVHSPAKFISHHHQRATAERVAYLPKRWASSEPRLSLSQMKGHAPTTLPLPGEPGADYIEKNMRQYQEKKRHSIFSEQETQQLKAQTVTIDNKTLEEAVQKATRIVLSELKNKISPPDLDQLHLDMLEIKQQLADLNGKLENRKHTQTK